MKKILFLTGTRADFGKLKSLIKKVDEAEELEAHIFVTGMHMIAKYGMTAIEVEKAGFKSIYKFINQNGHDSMDVILAKTIQGMSDYVKQLKPNMIVVHGDRVEALAGAIVGALNNILVSHIEGGEVSGTIDELIRHSVTKMSHLHFVSNIEAKNRLLQLGENKEHVYVIGSPDLDIMTSSKLPTLASVQQKYEIDYSEYAILMYHPVTTDVESIPYKIKQTIDALIESEVNYIVIYPNNDHGSDFIIEELERLKCNKRFRIFPSIRFECFLTLLKNSMFMIGNSSAGVREMPFYGLPSINLGSRQYNRAAAPSIENVDEDKESILRVIKKVLGSTYESTKEFGVGNSDECFLYALNSKDIWETDTQKVFMDIKK
jgi:UDP-N-acetylglucosamine 2-epimerase (hydrolysing)